MQIGSLDFTQAAMEKVRAASDRASEERMTGGGHSPAEAAAQMERLFATLLVKEMRKALPNGFFGKSAGADIFEGWFDQHLGESISKNDALDLASSIRLSIERKEARAEREQAEHMAANTHRTEQNDSQPD